MSQIIRKYLNGVTETVLLSIQNESFWKVLGRKTNLLCSEYD